MVADHDDPAPLPVPRFGDVAVALADGSILLAGGAEASASSAAQTPVPASPGPTGGEGDGEDESDMADAPCPPATSPAVRWVP